MNVLSLFDGMSCTQLALKKLGVRVDNYWASEVDKYAIKVTQANFPNTKQIGDVRNVGGSLTPPIDLLVGGSPCQGFSFAGKHLNFDDERSKLFFEFVRVLKEVKPKYFLLENVKMKKESEAVITEALGVEPIMINSSLVSGQNRKRLYWTNLPVEQPEDKGILLGDIIECGQVDREKSHCLDANYFKGGNLKTYFEKHRRQLVFGGAWKGRYNPDGSIIPPEWRKLTVTECERLQTVPEGYTAHVSNTQRYKMLGNGMTVDVIAHILKGLDNA